MMTHSLKLDSLQTIQTGIIENTNRSGPFFVLLKAHIFVMNAILICFMLHQQINILHVKSHRQLLEQEPLNLY